MSTSRLKAKTKPKTYADQLREWEKRRKLIVRLYDAKKNSLTFAEIGVKLGISKQRVQEIYRKAKGG